MLLLLSTKKEVFGGDGGAVQALVVTNWSRLLHASRQSKLIELYVSQKRRQSVYPSSSIPTTLSQLSGFCKNSEKTVCMGVYSQSFVITRELSASHLALAYSDENKRTHINRYRHQQSGRLISQIRWVLTGKTSAALDSMEDTLNWHIAKRNPMQSLFVIDAFHGKLLQSTDTSERLVMR